jgi:hypothetical protein
MRTTTTALAVGATALAIPTAAHAAAPQVQTSRQQMHAARSREVVHDRADRVVHRAHRLARLRHVHFSARAYRRRVRAEPPARLHDRLSALQRRIERAQAPAAPAVPPALQAIAACESGGNPATDTGNGFYGKYQFTLGTWQSIGGTGNPAQASEAEQDRRAAMLYAREGASPWPVCGR